MDKVFKLSKQISKEKRKKEKQINIKEHLNTIVSQLSYHVTQLTDNHATLKVKVIGLNLSLFYFFDTKIISQKKKKNEREREQNHYYK